MGRHPTGREGACVHGTVGVSPLHACAIHRQVCGGVTGEAARGTWLLAAECGRLGGCGALNQSPASQLCV